MLKAQDFPVTKTGSDLLKLVPVFEGEIGNSPAMGPEDYVENLS